MDDIHTHKNKYEIENISQHASTYFQTSLTNELFFLSFFILL